MPPAPNVLADAETALATGRPAEALAVAQQVGAGTSDPLVVVAAAGIQARALVALGRAGEAVTLLQSARDREWAAGRLGGGAALGVVLGEVQLIAGDSQGAIALLREAANGFAAANDPAGQVGAQLELASVYAMTQQASSARQILDGCVAEARRLGDPAILAAVRYQDGLLHMASSQTDAAVASLEDGLQAADRTLDPALQVQLRATLAPLLTGRDRTRATTLLAQAETIADGADPAAAGAGLATVAQGWRLIGETDSALRCGDAALGRFRAVGLGAPFISAALGLADLCAAGGNAAKSGEYAAEAIGVAGRLGGPQGEAEALFGLGQYAFGRGDRAAARTALQSAAQRLRAARLPLPPNLSAALTEVGGSA